MDKEYGKAISVSKPITIFHTEKSKNLWETDSQPRIDKQV